MSIGCATFVMEADCECFQLQHAVSQHLFGASHAMTCMPGLHAGHDQLASHITNCFVELR